MKVNKVEGTQAEVEVGGVTRTVSVLMTPEVKVGDYVLVHTGYAIGTVDEEEARITLDLLAQIAATYEDEPEEQAEA
jgi:hydrogenase expression/formation protein HypC